MTNLAPGRPETTDGQSLLSPGTLTAAALAVAVAQIGLSIPAVLNGLFQQDLGTTSTQLTWISDAFLVPVTLLELSFGVVGDLFGRKRLLAIGAALMAVGALLAFFTPGPGASHATRVAILLTGQALAGVGAYKLMSKKDGAPQLGDMSSAEIEMMKTERLLAELKRNQLTK